MSKFAQYSLILISFLTENHSEKYISLKKIAEKYHLSFAFLKQVALNLKNHDLLESMEGTNGGYRLKTLPEKISLDQVIKAIEQEKTPYLCSEHKCSLNCFCNIKFAWENAQVEAVKNLAKTKLSDFIGS